MTGLGLVAALGLRLLAQIGIAVTAPPDAGPRDPILVKVEVTAPAGRDVVVQPPSFAPFRLLSAMRVASVDSTAAGRRGAAPAWQVVEYRYVLGPPPDANGRYTFGPFVAEVTARGLRPAVARSRAWELAVRGAPPPVRAPAIVERARPRPRAGISFHALVAPETVYVGQQSTYQVAVFLDEEVRGRLRRNPEFLPPELRSMLAYDLVAGRASLRDQVVDGRRYDVHVFQRAIFPLAAGRVAIPPAQLTYSLPLSSGFFSREESYTARSEPATIVAVDPPAEGRPADWRGAVGALAASARVDTGGARVGDPIVYTVRVEGAGNVKLLPRPPLGIAWAGAVPAGERVTVDSTSLTVRGAKEFDWILTPRDTGALETPAVAYPYFDPDARRYETTVAAPVAVRVAPGTLALAPGDTAGGMPPLAIRRAYAGPVAPPLPSRPAFWVLVLLAPVPAAVVAAARRPRRPARPRSAVQRLDDLARRRRSGGHAGGARDVRRALAGALAERLAIDPDAPARAGALARLLRRRGVTPDTAAEAEAMLAGLAERAYSARGRAGDDAAAGREARDLYARVDAEACALDTLAGRSTPAGPGAGMTVRRGRAVGRGRGTGRGRGGTLVLLAGATLAGAVGTAAARAADADPAAGAFVRGVEAYGERRYDAARHEFEAAIVAEPRAADAWANLGTASWAAGDTVAAAVGWQRALRLEPLAADVRAHLQLLPAAAGGPVAGVPPVPPDGLLAAAAALWLLGWLVATLRAAGPPSSAPFPGRGAGIALAGAMVLGAAGGALTEHTRADRVAVVRAAGPLRAEPVLGADLGAPVEPADVARVFVRRAAWARVELDGGRSGWIEADRLATLTVAGARGR